MSLLVLKLYASDSSIVADLLDGTNYALRENGWAPDSATLSDSALAGRGLFAPLRDTYGLDIAAASALAASQNVSTLQRLLVMAEKFERSPVGPAVLLDAQITGGTLLTARVIGGRLALPSDYTDLLLGGQAWIEDVRLEVAHTTYQNPTPQTATSSATPAAQVMEALFTTAHPTDSPVKLAISGPSKTTVFPTSVVLWSDQAGNDGIRAVEAETATATNYTAITDPVTGTSPSGGQILRFTPPDTSEYATGTIALPSAAGLIAVYAMVRSSASAVTWTITPQLTTGVTAQTVRGKSTVLDGANLLNPTPVALDRVPITGAEGLTLAIKASTVSGAPKLDLDVIVLLNTSLGNSGAIEVPGGWEAGGASYPLTFDDQTLSAPSPAVYIGGGVSAKIPRAYAGPLPIVSGICTPSSPVAGRIRAVWLAPIGTGWRYNTSGTATTFTMTATRSRSYLLPE